MKQFEESIQKKYFSGINFSDERERQVFLSYLRGFALLILDPAVKNILEIGGGSRRPYWRHWASVSAGESSRWT